MKNESGKRIMKKIVGLTILAIKQMMMIKAKKKKIEKMFKKQKK